MSTSANQTELEFVTGVWNCEDIAHVPGTRWLIASGMIGPEHSPGHLYLVDMDTLSGSELFPVSVAISPVGAPYDDLSAPDAALFDAHGLDLRIGEGNQHLLYVVNHGGREAIEVFSVVARADTPVVAWIGAILQAPTVWGNAVQALSDGGIVITNYLSLEDPKAFDKVYAGEPTGNLKVWHAGQGWEDVPGTECCAPNGVGASPDGRWWVIASWSTKTLIRISRDRTPVERDEVPLGFLCDNVKWNAAGEALIAGQDSEPKEVFASYYEAVTTAFPVVAIKVDVAALKITEIARGTYDTFGTAATALEVGDDLWISNARGDRIARVVNS